MENCEISIFSLTPTLGICTEGVRKALKFLKRTKNSSLKKIV